MKHQPNILGVIHEGALFCSDDANDQNLLQEGCPCIMGLARSNLSRATINCRSTGPDKHIILAIYSKVIAYRPRRVATLDGA